MRLTCPEDLILTEKIILIAFGASQEKKPKRYTDKPHVQQKTVWHVFTNLTAKYERGCLCKSDRSRDALCQ
jgi:hypothetical protein